MDIIFGAVMGTIGSYKTPCGDMSSLLPRASELGGPQIEPRIDFVGSDNKKYPPRENAVVKIVK
jgi:hypothetical protein